MKGFAGSHVGFQGGYLGLDGLYTMCSSNLLQIDVKNTGWQFVWCILSPDLRKGLMCADFQSFGTHPVSSDCCNIRHNK